MAFHGFDGNTGGSGGAPKGGGMHSFTRPMSDINVTPLVDVMLVLLVIFIITAPLMASSIRLDLPRTSAARPSESDRKVTVWVARSGDVSIDDAVLAEPALLARLRAVAQVHPDTEVQLRADASVPYGRVVEVIGLAQQAGLNRVGFVAEPGTGATKP
jgi:biopolymer transport protein TolR